MGETHSITVIVDDRERASGLIEALRAVGGLRVATARLAVGDVWIGERVAVERKEAADFVASLLDGRLERQVRALAGLAGMCAVLIIEGEFSRRTMAGMAAGEVRAAMLALPLDWGVAVVRSRDVADTARWIDALARRQAGGASPLPLTYQPVQGTQPHPAAHRSSRTINPQSSLPLAALQQVPGLGPARARTLLAHFGTMARLLAAGEQDLAAAPGIGPALAKEIRQRFTAQK